MERTIISREFARENGSQESWRGLWESAFLGRSSPVFPKASEGMREKDHLKSNGVNRFPTERSISGREERRKGEGEDLG